MLCDGAIQARRADKTHAGVRQPPVKMEQKVLKARRVDTCDQAQADSVVSAFQAYPATE